MAKKFGLKRLSFDISLSKCVAKVVALNLFWSKSHIGTRQWLNFEAFLIVPHKTKASLTKSAKPTDDESYV